MGDVSIVIKDGHIVGVDGEDGDDSDVDAISGSGENEIDPDILTTPESPIYLTPTSNSTSLKSSSQEDDDLVPYIIAAVAGVIVLIMIVLLLCWCTRRRRQKSPTKKQHSGAVVYNPNGEAVGGEGYSVAIPLTAADPPLEDAPPPPVPASCPPKPPGLSASGGSTMSARYTPLGGRKDVCDEPMPSTSKDDEKGSIYESIDDNLVSNVYEEAKPALPKTNSGRRPHRLSSSIEDPNMGSEKDKMLPPSSPV